MIERRTDGAAPIIVMTECPACGFDLSDGSQRTTHIESHSPDDFGLTPLSPDAPGYEPTTAAD